MSKKNEHNTSMKLAIDQKLELGKMIRAGVAQKHRISVTTLVKWRHQYELYGVEGLAIRTRTNSYFNRLRMPDRPPALAGAEAASARKQEHRT